MKKKAIKTISKMLDENVEDQQKVNIEFIIRKIKEKLPTGGI